MLPPPGPVPVSGIHALFEITRPPAPRRDLRRGEDARPGRHCGAVKDLARSQAAGCHGGLGLVGPTPGQARSSGLPVVGERGREVLGGDDTWAALRTEVSQDGTSAVGPVPPLAAWQHALL